MDAGHVGQILLEALDRFQQPLRSHALPQVVGRVTGELLGKIAIGELPPAPPALFLGDLAGHQVGDDGCPQLLDSLDHAGIAPAAQPFRFRRPEHPLDQSGQAVLNGTRLALAEILNFLERQQGFAEACNPVHD